MSFVSSPDVVRLAGPVHNAAQSHLLQRWRSSAGHVSRGRCWTRGHVSPGHVTLMKPLRRFNKWIILCSRALSPPQSSLRSIHWSVMTITPPAFPRVTAACDTQPAWQCVWQCIVTLRDTGGSCTWPGPGHLLSQAIRRLYVDVDNTI